jgi:hypothetical protein
MGCVGTPRSVEGSGLGDGGAHQERFARCAGWDDVASHPPKLPTRHNYLVVPTRALRLPGPTRTAICEGDAEAQLERRPSGVDIEGSGKLGMGRGRSCDGESS